MKKNYQSPIVEVLSFESEDIVTVSILGMDNGDLVDDAEERFGEGGKWNGAI